jgi:hypothetical protein
MMSKKLIGMSLVGAVSAILSGCGGGGGNSGQVNPNPTNPYPYNQYNQQTSQPYNCAGNIQLRNAFGRSQCYPTTVLSEGCAQAGGILASNGTTCRKERPVGTPYRGHLGTLLLGKRNRTAGRYFSFSVPLSAKMYAGEVLKVSGDIDTDSNEWNAELMQQGIPVGSASSGSISPMDGSGNLSITAISSGIQPLYAQGQVPVQGAQPQYPNNQYPNNQYQTQYSDYGTIQSFSLNLMVVGSTDINIKGTAVSCEDGHGNSYPCQ